MEQKAARLGILNCRETGDFSARSKKGIREGSSGIIREADSWHCGFDIRVTRRRAIRGGTGD